MDSQTVAESVGRVSEGEKDSMRTSSSTSNAGAVEGADPALKPPRDPNTEQCETCRGWGVTRTGSMVEQEATRACVDCEGKGYRDLQGAAVQRLPEPAESSAVDDTLVHATFAPLVPPPPSPVAAPPVQPPAEPPGEPAPRRRRPSRKLVAAIIVLALVAAGAVAAAIVLISRSDGATSRTLEASITTLPLAAPTSVIASGILVGQPFGRVAVITQRRLAGSPRPGGPPVPFEGNVLVLSPDGFMSLDIRGTVRVTPQGGEVVRAKGTVSNGAGDFSGVKGSVTVSGGVEGPNPVYDQLRVTGTLKY